MTRPQEAVYPMREPHRRDIREARARTEINCIRHSQSVEFRAGEAVVVAPQVDEA